MAHAKSVLFLVALLVSTATASSPPNSRQSTFITSPSRTDVPATSVTPLTDASRELELRDRPHSLWTLADSIISAQFPSSTPANLATVSWTVTAHPPESTNTADKTGDRTKGTESTHSATPTAVDSEAAKSSNGSSDKTLAIAIGVSLGAVAVAVMGVVFFCLWRRRKNTGSFFMRRRTPSIISTGSWRPFDNRGPHNMGTTSYIEGPLSPQRSKQPGISVMAMARGNTPPMTMHPALQEQSSRSTSDDNPFYTPGEGSSFQLDHHELDSQPLKQHAELEHDEPSNRRSSSSMQNSRPPTPFSPMMMMQMPTPAARPQLHVNSNPFSSAEDAEADDVVSPILPARSPERRHSPMVHYPSWDEVSDFDFSGNERRRSAQDSGDGWHPSRQRVDGRHELA